MRDTAHKVVIVISEYLQIELEKVLIQIPISFNGWNDPIYMHAMFGK